MEETPLEAVPSSAPLSKRKINKRFVYLVLVVLIALAIFGFKNFIFSPSKKSVDEKAAATTPTQMPTETPVLSPSESPTPSETNTPTPKPTANPVDKQSGLNRSKLSITVENGSGEAGVAQKASDILKNLGYDVVKTGNADNFDYLNVFIQVKSANQDFLSLLKKDLGFSYSIGTTSSDLSNGFSSDALVIIGK